MSTFPRLGVASTRHFLEWMELISRSLGYRQLPHELSGFMIKTYEKQVVDSGRFVNCSAKHGAYGLGMDRPRRTDPDSHTVPY